MRRLFASLFTIAFLGTSPAHAVMEDYPSVKLQGLDKSVGRTVTFEAKVGSTIQYGPLFIKIHACRKAPPIEKPESASFLQIWEVPPGAQKSEWVFSGWMFASSPALSAMDHPVYDVWVLDCLGKEEPNEEAAIAETKEEAADQTSLTPADPSVETETNDPVEQTPQQDIPTDSEAEEPSPADQVAPVQTPYETPATETPSVETPQEQPQTQTPPASTYPYDPDAAYVPNRPTDPTRDPVTAYDLMKRQGTNAQPLTPQQQAAPAQVEEEAPNY